MSLSEKLMDTRCAYCDQRDGRLIMRTGDPYLERPNTFDVVACGKCGLIRTRQLPAELSRWYKEHYSKALQVSERTQCAAKARSTYQLLDKLGITRTVRKFHLNHPAFIASQIPPVGRILEIGCGSGEILRRLKAKGAEVFGVEPHPDSADAARRHGVQVVCDKVESLENVDIVFDTVLLSFALEHTQEPLKALNFAHHVLADTAKLFVFTHNFNCLSRYIFGESWSGWHLPYHTYFFTEKSLRRMLVTAGYRVTSARSYTRPDLLVESCRLLLARLYGTEVVPFARSTHLGGMLTFSLLTKPFGIAGWGNALKVVATPRADSRSTTSLEMRVEN